MQNVSESGLQQLGLSDAAINAAWPEWWSEAAEPSPSASLDLRFSLARKLGLGCTIACR